MKQQGLPWASLTGPVYRAREGKPRKAWVTVGGWMASGLLIVGGLTTRWRIAAVFGVLYVLALLMDKDVVVTQRGLELFYQMKITTHYEVWPWEEVRALLRDDKKSPAPGLTALHFVRGDKSRKLFFTNADAEKVMALARERHPGIRVENVEGNPGGPAPKQNKKKK